MNKISFSRMFALSLVHLLVMANIGNAVGEEGGWTVKNREQEKQENGDGEGQLCFFQEGRDAKQKTGRCPMGIECMESKCFNGTANIVIKGCAKYGNNTCEMEKKKCEEFGKDGRGGKHKNCTICGSHFCNALLEESDLFHCYDEQLDEPESDETLRTCYGNQCISLMCIYVHDKNETAFNITRACATDGKASCARIGQECVANGGKPSNCVQCTERFCNNMHHPPKKEKIIEWWFMDRAMPIVGTGTTGESSSAFIGDNSTTSGFGRGVPSFVPILATFFCLAAMF